MLNAVEEVLSAGQMMSSASKEFADDPCTSTKRGNMVCNLFPSYLKAVQTT